MGKKEKPETKLCKHCQTEIPYDAKVCPQCRKKVKGGKIKWIIIVIVVLLAIAAAAGGGSSDKETKKVGEVAQTTEPAAVETEAAASETPDVPTAAEEASSSESEPVEEVQTAYYVGDILQDGDMKIVYVASGVYEESNEFMQPDEGNQYIYLRFAFENTSDNSDASISSFSFNCYADGYAVDDYYGGDESLSATLSAGRSTTGCVYFEVPIDAQDIEVEYTTNFFTEEKINFIYEGEKDSGYTVAVNTAASEDAYSVGDVVESKELRITYLSCEEYVSDNMFLQPKDGYHYVSCEFEFENLGTSDEYISSLDFDCYADGVNCEDAYVRDDSISATLSAGRKTKGTVTFEVPVDAAVVEVEYLTNYWTSNRVVFSAN